MKNQFTKSQQEHLSCGLKRAKHLCCKHVINSKVSDGVYWDCQSSNKIVQVSFNPHLSQREYEAPRNFCSGYKAGIANNSKNWSCSRTFLETLALFPRRLSWQFSLCFPNVLFSKAITREKSLKLLMRIRCPQKKQTTIFGWKSNFDRKCLIQLIIKLRHSISLRGKAEPIKASGNTY